MSSAASFDVLLAVSRALEDDFIDEDISEMQEGSGRNSRTVSNRRITVRGKRDGQPLVLCYQDYYSTSFSPRSIPVYERRVLEVFAAQPAIRCEAVVCERGVLDKVARWFGGGGAKGPHPIFERMRIDVEEGDAANFEHPTFPGALEGLARASSVLRVELHNGSGLTAVGHWYGEHTDVASTLAFIDRVRAVTATLDPS